MFLKSEVCYFVGCLEGEVEGRVGDDVSLLDQASPVLLLQSMNPDAQSSERFQRMHKQLFVFFILLNMSVQAVLQRLSAHKFHYDL